jgi:endonuclease/exonuclease/phosphatase family metal-dependent hydrolase
MFREGDMRVATWNLDHASNNSRPVDLQIQQINRVDPDILVLTETCEKVDLAPYGYSSVSPQKKNQYGKFWSTIWSKYPIVKQIETYDTETAVCAEIDTPLGAIIVYGTILCYHGYKGPNNSPVWFEHHKTIKEHSDDWFEIRSKDIGQKPFVVCGDFNQTRDGSKAYCSKGGESISLLNEQLTRNNLTCLTEEDFGRTGKLNTDPKKGSLRNNIDHICMSHEAFTVREIGAWDHFTESEKYMTDHNGVYVDLSKR